MRLKLLTGMGGDGVDYKPDQIVDTIWFVSKQVNDKGFVVDPNGELVLTAEGLPQKPANAQQIADAWIAAGIAKIPDDVELNAAAVSTAATRAEDAERREADTREAMEQLSAEHEALKAQVDHLAEAATDPEALTKATAEVVRLQKVCDEKDRQLGEVRDKVTAELRPLIEAEVAEKFEAELETARRELAEATEKLAAAEAAAA